MTNEFDLLNENMQLRLKLRDLASSVLARTKHADNRWLGAQGCNYTNCAKCLSIQTLQELDELAKRPEPRSPI